MRVVVALLYRSIWAYFLNIIRSSSALFVKKSQDDSYICHTSLFPRVSCHCQPPFHATFMMVGMFPFIQRELAVRARITIPRIGHVLVYELMDTGHHVV